ncbi:DsrE family protein [Thiogranum longum]
MARLIACVLLLNFALFAGASAAFASSVDELLAAEQAPPGVVFEIVSGDSDLLGDLLPDVRKDIERLRKRFPDLPVVIVSHGEEQFALTNDRQQTETKLHSLAEELVTEQDVTLHVCETYAGWFGVAPGDFPEFVDVAAAGPAQINDYRALDYVVITLP